MQPISQPDIEIKTAKLECLSRTMASSDKGTEWFVGLHKTRRSA